MMAYESSLRVMEMFTFNQVPDLNGPWNGVYGVGVRGGGRERELERDETKHNY